MTRMTPRALISFVRVQSLLLSVQPSSLSCILVKIQQGEAHIWTKKTHKYSTLRWSRSRAASTDQRMSGNGEIYIDIAYIHCGSMSPVRIPTTRIHFPLSASVELVIMSHSPGFTSAPCPYIDLYPFDVYTTYTEGYEERNVEHNDERLTLYPYHLEFKTGPRLVCERLVLQKSAGRWCMRFLRRHRRWYRQPEALHPLRLCRDDGSSG